MLRNWRALSGGIVSGVAAALALAVPAVADVTVTPEVAPRGGPAALVFTVPEERPKAHTTKVELLVPEATPIAEVYPMSVDGWAPLTSSRKLAKPLALIHGTRTSEVVSKVTWKRVGKTAPKPGQPALLKLSMGPMPDVEQVSFAIVQTYSDGTVVRWADAAGGKNAAPVIRLLDIEEAKGDHSRGEAPKQEAAAPASDSSEGGAGGGDGATWLVAAGLLVVLAFAAEGWILLARRRGAAKPA